MCHWRCGALIPEITEVIWKMIFKNKTLCGSYPAMAIWWQKGWEEAANKITIPIDPDLQNQFCRLLRNLSDMEQGFATTQLNSVPKKKTPRPWFLLIGSAPLMEKRLQWVFVTVPQTTQSFPNNKTYWPIQTTVQFCVVCLQPWVLKTQFGGWSNMMVFD